MATIKLTESQMRTLMQEMMTEAIDSNDPETFIGGYFSFRNENGQTIGVPIEDCDWSEEDRAFRFFNYSMGGASLNVIVNPMDLEHLTHKPGVAKAKLVVSSEDGDREFKGTIKWSKGPKYGEMADKK